jgi:hypothetical protein
MRTTIRVDDDLLEQLKAQARRDNVSLTRLISRALAAGLQAGAERSTERVAYREPARSLGVPYLSLDKALARAVALADDEIVRKTLQRRRSSI